MSSLSNRKIILGVTGGIAAYKSPDIVRKLRKAGAEVRVVMTESAKAFITSLTLQAVSGNPVHDELFDEKAEAAMGHIELAKWADLILIAPASANTIAKLAAGKADDLLTTLCLASTAKRALAPAMNQQMWRDESTEANLKILEQRRFEILGPDEGSQACGDIGPGRMLESETIIGECEDLFETGSLAGVSILMTAGPTQEAIDPVRYITNHSSGKMGYAIARSAIDAGAKVTMVTGPVNLAPVEKCKTKFVVSTEEMLQAVEMELPTHDIFIGVAAVSDYRVKNIAEQKIKKSNENMRLELIKNPDVLKNVSNSKQRPKIVIGFAAETENLIDNSKKKLRDKNLDMIVANHVGTTKNGFNTDHNEVTIITKHSELKLESMHKQHVADAVIAKIAEEYKDNA